MTELILIFANLFPDKEITGTAKMFRQYLLKQCLKSRFETIENLKE